MGNPRKALKINREALEDFCNSQQTQDTNAGFDVRDIDLMPETWNIDFGSCTKITTRPKVE
jgi:hypothetical protein